MTELTTHWKNLHQSRTNDRRVFPMRADVMRATVQRLCREVPFRPFVITLENRQRLVVEHPENIAFRPDDNGRRGSREFYVATDNTWIHSAFEAVTSVTQDQPAEAQPV